MGDNEDVDATDRLLANGDDSEFDSSDNGIEWFFKLVVNAKFSLTLIRDSFDDVALYSIILSFALYKTSTQN